MEASEWIVVTDYKRQRASKKQKKIHGVSTPIFDLTKDRQTQQLLSSSNIVKQTCNGIKDFLKNAKQSSVIHVEALGLGNFQRDAKPRIQFYLLKQILQELKSRKVTLNAYDPVFDNSCLKMLQDVMPSSTNLSKYPYKKQKSHIIYFMPHCQKQLYIQVLQEHPSTSELLIIGNSFRDYVERQRIMGENKTPVFNGFLQQKVSDFEGAFNDTYIMTKQ